MLDLARALFDAPPKEPAAICLLRDFINRCSVDLTAAEIVRAGMFSLRQIGNFTFLFMHKRNKQVENVSQWALQVISGEVFVVF